MKKAKQAKTHTCPPWVKDDALHEKELCSECFKVVGVESRYALVLFLGRQQNGATVTAMTDYLGLKQPTVTHHLNILRSVDAVYSEDHGRERVYCINRNAHCFEECAIPFD